MLAAMSQELGVHGLGSSEQPVATHIMSWAWHISAQVSNSSSTTQEDHSARFASQAAVGRKTINTIARHMHGYDSPSPG